MFIACRTWGLPGQLLLFVLEDLFSLVELCPL